MKEESKYVIENTMIQVSKKNCLLDMSEGTFAYGGATMFRENEDGESGLKSRARYPRLTVAVDLSEK